MCVYSPAVMQLQLFISVEPIRSTEISAQPTTSTLNDSFKSSITMCWCPKVRNIFAVRKKLVWISKRLMPASEIMCEKKRPAEINAKLIDFINNIGMRPFKIAEYFVGVSNVSTVNAKMQRMSYNHRNYRNHSSKTIPCQSNPCKVLSPRFHGIRGNTCTLLHIWLCR